MSRFPAELKFTYEDYLLLPEDKRYQLIDGDLYMVPAPNIAHQRISRQMATLLWGFVGYHDLGEVLQAPVDVYLSEYDVVQPDLVFVAKERLGIIEENRIRGGPDLVVEILSPSSLKFDREIKMKLYARHGVREYWIADPAGKSVEAHENRRGALVLGSTFVVPAVLVSPLIPGFELPLEDVFPK
jgi:Uma2 family endonuclease